MIRSAGLWAVLFGLWLLLSGHYDPLFIVFGIATCSVAVFVARRMGALDAESAPFHLAGRAVAYVPWLIWEVLRSNIQVARTILSPRMPIDPAMVHFRSSQKTDLGRFVYANSITLTPGTVTTGVVGDDLEVHALSQAHVDGSEENDMNRRVSVLEQGRG